MNSTSSVVSIFLSEADLLQKVGAFIVSSRYELALFVAAIVAHFLLFGSSLLKTSNRKAVRTKSKAGDSPRIREKSIAPDSSFEAEGSIQAAFESGDYKQVLRHWNALKKGGHFHAGILAQVVESMQRMKRDTPSIVSQLKVFFQADTGDRDIVFVNELLESLGKRLDSQLMEEVVEILPSVRLYPDQRTYEILLTTYFTTRDFSEVKRLMEEMRVRKVSFTTRALIVAIKTALKTNSLEEAVWYFRELKGAWAVGGSANKTVSTAPRHIISQLVELACQDHRLDIFIAELEGVPLTEEIVHKMISECVRQRDRALAQRVEALAQDQKISLSEGTCSLLIRVNTNQQTRVQAIFDDVVTRKLTLSMDFVQASLAFCNQTGTYSLANSLYEYMHPKQLPVLSAFVRFYAENEQYDRVCDIYEKDLVTVQSEGEEPQQSRFLDSRLERMVMNAALRCGRNELMKRFLDSSPSDVARHIVMIRNCAAANDLKGAMNVFKGLKDSGVELNSIAYNTVLDACVECHDLKAAQGWIEQMKNAGMADVVSYNTLVKAHLHSHNFDKAWSLMEEMRCCGLQPNSVTYNELVNAIVTRGTPERRAQVWDIIEQMKAAGVKPTQVTCSILLKNLDGRSRESEILKTMDLLGGMGETMDEVLLSSVVEACVRIGKPDLLAAQLKQLENSENVAINGSHTFGSLIKAYGHAKDLQGVWRCWKEMRSRHIRPTSITLGCMVEAIVSNGDAEGAYELIQQVQDDEQCRGALNSVIYCSVLKGFTREKRIERVWAVYEEMKRKGIEVSIVMFNTLVDACARCGHMERIPAIVGEMKEAQIKPNLITYSTMIKGHCQLGDIQTGLAILHELKTETTLKPDEIMYNSLLDGCAKNNLVEEGLRLLRQMQDEGVQPSNYTLSILVKLMNRARKLDGAFDHVEEITRRYGFRANAHVYANLVQACVFNKQLIRCISTLSSW